MKPKLCLWPGCKKEVRFFPNSTIKRKYCEEHAIRAVLAANREAERQSKAELENARKNCKNGNAAQKRNALASADKWFSRYIRLKYSFERNGELWCECYTCRQHFRMLACDNGHWQKRINKATRFHENNARPQCTECNDHKHGEFAIFEHRLIEEIGEESVEELRLLARSVGEDSFIFYKEQSDKYRKAVNQLLKQRHLSNPW